MEYPNKKIYVTEAYSSDNTYEILKTYGNKIKLERVKGNAPTAHNHVFKKINSDLIAFTDADCVVDKIWLKNLVKVFTSDDIVAAGGFCKTPQDVNHLQQLIGRELENRFHKIPKNACVSRLPTMNLCVRTYVVKKVKMDESLDVTFESDWGNRLTRLGKMVYVPDAVVYHYHRSDLKSFFKQQLNYGKFVIKRRNIYIGYNKFGDYLSTPLMGIQLLSFNFFILISLMSLWIKLFLVTNLLINLIASVFFLIFILSLISDIKPITKNSLDIFKYIALFFVRTVAWSVGILIGAIDLLRGK